MATDYPGAIDTTKLTNPATTDKRNSPSHAGLHANAQDAIKALETKLGTGSNTPATSTLLFGTGAGTSAWQTLTSANLAAVLTDETGTGSAVFATTPTLVTPKIDTINESTPSNGTTIGGVNIKSGALNTNNSVVTANLADSAVTPAKLFTGTGSSWAWQTWSPTWTNLTVGNGTTSYAYTQIGKSVFFYMYFALGSTSSVGTGPTFTLPVTASARFALSARGWLGDATYVQTGTAAFTGYIYSSSSTTIATLATMNTASTYSTDAAVTAAIPFSWASTHTLSISGRYEAA